MKTLKVKDLDLDNTLSCGQVFRWDKHQDGFWYGFIGGNVIKIRRIGNILEYSSKASPAKIKAYFNLGVDYKKIIRTFPKDRILSKAVKKFWGLRLIKQDPFECLLSYIFSSQNNIPRINKMVNELSRRLGRKIKFEGHEYFLFPTIEALTGCSKDHIKACRLGFRDKYLYDAVDKLASKEIDLKNIAKMNYKKAREELLKIKGVGPKVADCVLLFGFNKYEAFPVDVWIDRIMKKYYKGKSSAYFGKYAGYAQEFLYMFIRNA